MHFSPSIHSVFRHVVTAGFLLVGCCPLLQGADWTLPQFMIDYGSDVGNELQAAETWLDYFKYKQANPGHVDPDQVNKMVDRLQERVDQLSRQLPPAEIPARPPSSNPLPRTADVRSPDLPPRANQTTPNRTVDLNAGTSNAGKTRALESTGREVAEEVAESTLKQTARGAGRFLGKILPAIDLLTWGVDAYDGTTSYLAAQDAFEAEQTAEQTREQLMTRQLLELHREMNKHPERFKSDVYTPEEMENLVRVNVDLGNDPFDGLTREEPVATAVAEPMPPTQPLTEPMPPSTDDAATIANFLELMARLESAPEPQMAEDVLPQVPVTGPEMIEEPLEAVPPVEIPVAAAGAAGPASDGLDNLSVPSGPQQPGQLDVLQNFMRQLNQQSRSGHSAGTLSDSSPPLLASSSSRSASSATQSAAASAMLERLKSDPALRQQLLDSARSRLANSNTGSGAALRQSAGDASARPALRTGIANAAQAAAANRPRESMGLGNRLNGVTGTTAAPVTRPVLQNRGTETRIGQGLGQGLAQQRPAAAAPATPLRNRIQNAAPVQTNNRPAGGLRGRLGNRR